MKNTKIWNERFYVQAFMVGGLQISGFLYIYIYIYIAQNDERVVKKQLIIGDEELKKNLSNSIIV